jgi:hypothetical protein
MEYVILVGFFGFLIAIVVLALRHGKKVNARKRLLFVGLGEKHGLQHLESKYLMNKLNSLSGIVNGMEVQLYEKVIGSGKNQQITTNLSLTPSPFDFEFRIGKEHFFSKTGKLLGMNDIEFGDEVFDKKFLLKSKEEEKFKAIITYEVQQKLKDIADDLKGSIHGNLGHLAYSTGPLANQVSFASFEKVFDFMVSMQAAIPVRKVSY